MEPRMRILRKARALRQLDLALSAGLSQATIWNAEHGLEISRSTKQKIAAALGVRVNDLFDHVEK